jgi:hypothetical protein
MSRTRKAQFKSDVTDVTAGFYDFEKFTVSLGLVPDPSLVSLSLEHESLHQRLNRHSTFGQIIETVASLVREAKLQQRALNELVGRCVGVHETLATHNSIVRGGRKDLLPQLPGFYQRCFQNMEQALIDLPVNWRVSSCWHLSRIAMLVPIEDWRDMSPTLILRAAKNVPSPDHRLEIIMKTMRQFDLTRLIKLMKKWGADNSLLEAFRSESDEAAILRKLAATKKWSGNEWLDVQSNFELFMTHAFLDYFEDIFPGLQTAHEDAFSYSHMASLSYSTAPGTNGQRDEKLMQYLSELCNQNVRVLPGTIRGREWKKSSRVLQAFLEQSLSNFGCLFLFVYPTDEQIAFDLVHVSEPGTGLVDHYRLSQQELEKVVSLGQQIVSVAEVPNFELTKPSLLPILAQRMHVFVVQRGNPIERIEALLQGGVHKIDCWQCRIGHQNGPLLPTLGLQLCFYWIDGNKCPSFHLSNEMMSNAIEAYGEVLRRAGISFTILKDDEALDRLPQQLVSWFSDHPILNYYFFNS